MPLLALGLGLYLFDRWLRRRPFAFARIETGFWFICVSFVALILLALIAQAVAG